MTAIRIMTPAEVIWTFPNCCPKCGAPTFRGIADLEFETATITDGDKKFLRSLKIDPGDDPPPS